MNAGKLNKRIILRTYTQTTDASGFVSNGTATDTTVWANVKPLNGKRAIEEGREFNVEGYQIKLRYNANIINNLGDYQIIYDSKTLKINSFMNVSEDKNYFEIIAVNG